MRYVWGMVAAPALRNFPLSGWDRVEGGLGSADLLLMPNAEVELVGEFDELVDAELRDFSI